MSLLELLRVNNAEISSATPLRVAGVGAIQLDFSLRRSAMEHLSSERTEPRARARVARIQSSDLPVK
jgi:hypothetical protein